MSNINRLVTNKLLYHVISLLVSVSVASTQIMKTFTDGLKMFNLLSRTSTPAQKSVV